MVMLILFILNLNFEAMQNSAIYQADLQES